jgi:hypothetical protein
MAHDSARIRHTVVFTLKHSFGSEEQRDFMNAAQKLSGIGGVEKFECLRQVSKKNKFEYGLSMEFANQPLYDHYTNHPDHVYFVQNCWMNEVEDFIEIDYQII